MNYRFILTCVLVGLKPSHATFLKCSSTSVFGSVHLLLIEILSMFFCCFFLQNYLNGKQYKIGVPDLGLPLANACLPECEEG